MEAQNIIVGLVVVAVLTCLILFANEFNSYTNHVNRAKVLLAEAGYPSPKVVPTRGDKDCLDFNGVHVGKWRSAHESGRICGEVIYVRH